MKVSPFSPPNGSRRHLPLAEWAREANLSKAAVASRAKRGQIQWLYVNHRSGRLKFGQRLYWVGDLPESCGSPYLVNYLLNESSWKRKELLETEEKLERVMRHRRSRSVAA